MNKSLLLVACLVAGTGLRAQTPSLWFVIENATDEDLSIQDVDTVATQGNLYLKAGESAPNSFRGCQKLGRPGDNATLKPGKNWAYCDTTLGAFAMNFRIRKTTFNVKFAKSGTTISNPWLSALGDRGDLRWTVDQRGFLNSSGPAWLTIH